MNGGKKSSPDTVYDTLKNKNVRYIIIYYYIMFVL